MKKILLVLSVITLSLLSANNNLDKEISKCSQIKGELDRLSCYDEVAKNNKLTVQKIIIKNTGNRGEWDTSISSDPLTDKTTVVLALRTSNSPQIHSFMGKPILVLRCANNLTELYINWDSYLGGKAYVTTRVGREKAFRKYWNTSTDGKGSFYPKSPIKLIRKMIKADKVVFQITPYNESPMTAIFDIKGLENAIEPLAKTCGWKIK